MRALVIDGLWTVAAFVVVTVVVSWLRQQGVAVPGLPDWVTGL